MRILQKSQDSPGPGGDSLRKLKNSMSGITISVIKTLLLFPLQTFWIISEHPATLPLANYNAQQCVHCVKKDLDDLLHFDDTKQTRKLDYTERLCEEHTYTAMQGQEYRPRCDQSVRVFINNTLIFSGALQSTMKSSSSR